MVLTPGFYQQTHEPRKRGRRERWVLAIGGILTTLVIAIAIVSLTSPEPKSGHGCLNFTYPIVMGGEQFHACGAEAKKYCRSPPKLGGLANGLTDRLKDACREAGLPTHASS